MTRSDGIQCIHDNIHAEFRIVFGEEAFVAEVVVPLTSIIFIAIKYADAAIDGDGLEVVVYKIVPPTVELEGSVGRSFLKMEKGIVDGVVIGDFFQGGWAEQVGHLCFE